jgi:hypothetical protein
MGLYANRTPEYTFHAMAHTNRAGELRGGTICAEAAFVLRDTVTGRYYPLNVTNGCLVFAGVQIHCLSSP